MGEQRKELGIKQNILWNSIGSAIGMGCQWAISILVVRLSSDMTNAGLYSLAMSIYSMFSPIANFGLYSYIITDVEDRHSSGEYLTFVFFTNIACLAISTLYAFATCRPNAWPIIISYVFYKAVVTFIDIMHAIDQKAHRMDYVGISQALQGIASIMVFGVVILVSQNLVISIIGMSMSAICIGFIFDLPKTLSLSPIEFGISLRAVAAIVSSCTLIVISNVATGSFASFPRQILSSMMGDASLGIYASVATPVAIVQVASTYIYNPLIGYYSESYHKCDARRFWRLSRATLVGILSIGILSLIGTTILAEPVLRFLYGAEVASYSNLMLPLIFSSLLLGIAGFLSNLLVAVRSLRVMVLGSFLSLAIVCFCARGFVGSLGMNGATLSLIVGCLGSILVSFIGITLRARAQFSDK